MKHFDTMDRSIMTFAFLMLALATQVWSLAIKSNDERSDMKESNDDVMKREHENVDLQQRDNAELRRSYAMLLDSMPSNGNHPFGFGISREHRFLGKKKRDYFPQYVQSRAFHGKRESRDQGPDDQNTSVFHGKRSGDLVSEWLNERDAPPALRSSKIFHGKKGMDEFMQYLLKDLDNESTQNKK